MKKQPAYIFHPCLVCGKKDVAFLSDKPEGRHSHVWCVVCSCGQVTRPWSVSQGAAVRAWNRLSGQEKSKLEDKQ